MLGRAVAMLVAVTALVVSLGGNSYAAIKLSKDSVTSKAIKDGQVQRADLAKDAVGTGQVADGSLLAADFKPGQLPAGPFLPVHVRKDDMELRFFTTLTALGTPLDVTAQEVHIESYFPADEATERFVETMARPS